MRLISLDTHLLIWGIKEDPAPGQEDMVPRTKRFFEWMDSSGIKGVISTVVVGELLVRVPQGEHADFISLLSKKFLVANYDVAAASCFAAMWQKRLDEGAVKKIKEDLSASKELLKADCLIAANAKTKGAEAIYSYDEHMPKIAEGFIEVRRMPPLDFQGEIDLPNANETNNFSSKTWVISTSPAKLKGVVAIPARMAGVTPVVLGIQQKL